MKILVIGSSGMLGSDLFLEFQKTRHEIVGIGHRDLDITKQSLVKNYIQHENPKLVLLTAAFTRVDDCEIQRELAWSINVEGTRYVALACQSVGARLCYISTDYIFNGKKMEPYKEDDSPDPLNFYAVTKLNGEMKVKESSDDFLIVRTSWLFGAHGRNFVKTILKKAKLEPVIKVVNDQIGCPTYTGDLASAIISLIEKKVDGVVNVTNEGSCSWYEFAKQVLASVNQMGIDIQPISSQFLDAPARRPSNSCLATERFQELTGKPLRPWQEALNYFIKTYVSL